MGSVKIIFPCGSKHDFPGFAHSKFVHVSCFFLLVVFSGIFEAAFCCDEVFLEVAAYLFTTLHFHGNSLLRFWASVLSQFVAPAPF